MGGSTTPARAEQVSKVELPPWVNQASQENYTLAKNIAERPLEQYQGPMVAGASPLTTSALDLTRTGAGAELPIFDQARDQFTKAGGIADSSLPFFTKAGGLLDSTNPLYKGAEGLYGESADMFRRAAGPLDVNAYLNPYTNEVEANAIRNVNENLAKNLVSLKSGALSNPGAWGGSRAGIQGANLQSQSIRDIGDLSAKLRAAGFDTATSTALADRAKYATAGTGLAGAGGGLLSTASGIRDAAAGNVSAGTGMLNAASTAGNVGTGLINAGTARQGSRMADIAALFQGGQTEQGQRQAEIDAAMKKFYEMRDYPLEGLNTRLAALGMTPYGKTETTNKTSTSEDKGLDWASILLGGAKIGAGIYGMSDRTTKTDIEKIADGEIPIYAYRYKGDPKTYPKVVGPMAQDIEKKFPKAVKKVGKKRVIDYDNLLEALA